MRPDKAVNIADLHRMAKRRLPKIVFDFIEGGCDGETVLARNENSFLRYGLMPRFLIDTGKRDQSTTLFGRRYASPFGIAPTGLAALYRPRGDLLLAEAAGQADIPFIQSGASTASMADVVKTAPDHAWYQLYAPRDQTITDDLVRRARDAGFGVLVLTIDTQGSANHERNVRNGFSPAMTVKPSAALEALRHPLWLADYLWHGMPAFEDWRAYAPAGASAKAVAQFVAAAGRVGLTWRDVERIRGQWPGKFVLKGILSPDDAVRAAECGVDGIIVSNHGGRRMDRSPAALDAFPAINAAVGARVTLMLDSGIRRGADILTALSLGAKFCFTGRATLYGMAAGGLPGAQRAIAILRNEIDVVMSQIGCTAIPQLGPPLLFTHPARADR